VWSGATPERPWGDGRYSGRSVGGRNSRLDLMFLATRGQPTTAPVPGTSAEDSRWMMSRAACYTSRAVRERSKQKGRAWRRREDGGVPRGREAVRDPRVPVPDPERGRSSSRSRSQRVRSDLHYWRGELDYAKMGRPLRSTRERARGRVASSGRGDDRLRGQRSRWRSRRLRYFFRGALPRVSDASHQVVSGAPGQLARLLRGVPISRAASAILLPPPNHAVFKLPERFTDEMAPA